MADRVGVVGCGLMGSGIAEVCARAGIDTLVCEIDEPAVRVGERRVHESLSRAMSASKLTGAELSAAYERLRFTTDLADLTDRDLVIEAISEDEQAKVALFAELDRIVENPDAVIASNTSSISIVKLAAATGRPANVVGIHFFHPVPVVNLAELVTSLTSSVATRQSARWFVTRQLRKAVIDSQDRAGFVVNALMVPYLLSAIRMLESGLATAEDIDSAMRFGCAHPMGPLALTDLIGLDTAEAIARSMYAEFKEPLYAPPPLLIRMVEGGLLGRKTGRGFHTYARHREGAPP